MPMRKNEPIKQKWGQTLISAIHGDEHVVEYIRAALERSGGLVEPAAQELGVSRWTLRRELERRGHKGLIRKIREQSKRLCFL